MTRVFSKLKFTMKILSKNDYKLRAGFKMGTWFVPAQPRTKPGLSPIPPNVPSWCRVSWLLKGLAWRMALSCHSQANHRGRGSDATHKLGSWTCCPQTHRGGGHCRRPVAQAAVGVSPSASPFGHALLPVSQLARVYHLLISFIHSPTLHPSFPFVGTKF